MATLNKNLVKLVTNVAIYILFTNIFACIHKFVFGSSLQCKIINVINVNMKCIHFVMIVFLCM